jgi:gamma-polyglutamate synthase
MFTVEVLAGLILLLVILGAYESFNHRRRLAKIPHRIHVNGTRGKSSVTRLIASGLRAGGIRTCAKVTGTLPSMILPDDREIPVYRPAQANVIEQVRIVAAAAAHDAQALVIECMALQPEYQWLCENKFVRATHGVITNTREDHLDIMGPTEKDVAKALAGMIPRKAKLFTAERRQFSVLESAAKDRQSEIFGVTDQDIATITEEELETFSYHAHPDNVALALKVCAEFGVERSVALAGMQQSRPDVGAMTDHLIHFFGKNVVFVNGFAANDPESTEQIWRSTLKRYEETGTTIAVFNCRGDRPDRSIQLGGAYARWPQADRVVLMGTGTYLFARAAIRAGLDESKFVFLEGSRTDEIFESIIGLIRADGLVMGMANIGGQGLELVSYFKNREAPKGAA